MLMNAEIMEAFNLIARLPDDAVIEVGLAAIFLGISEESLRRYRKHGGGPHYLQYPQNETKSRNQKINYEMGILREWRKQHRVESTMDAAIKRGMAFSRINDLLVSHPFWVCGNSIITHALDMSKETFASLLQDPANQIIWMSWPKAFKMPWSDHEAKANFRAPYTGLLSSLIADSYVND
jgi:hypothetical protein